MLGFGARHNILKTSTLSFHLLCLQKEAVEFLFLFILAEMLIGSQMDRSQAKGRREKEESRVDSIDITPSLAV